MKAEILDFPYQNYVGYLQTIKDRKYYHLWNRSSNDRKLISLARYKMSVKLKRFLTKEEEVDHIDGDKTNDDLSNLQILSGFENKRKQTIETGRSSKPIKLRCPVCRSNFERFPTAVTHKLNRGKTPCCSRRCGSIFGSRKKSKIHNAEVA